MTKRNASPNPTGRPAKPASVLDRHLDDIVSMKLAGVSDRAIADKYGLVNSTVSRFVARPEVQRAIDAAHGELLKRASRQMATMAGAATQTLAYYIDPANAGKIAHRYRLDAVKIVLNTLGQEALTGAVGDLAAAVTDTAAETGRAKAVAMQEAIEAQARDADDGRPGLSVVE